MFAKVCAGAGTVPLWLQGDPASKLVCRKRSFSTARLYRRTTVSKLAGVTRAAKDSEYKIYVVKHDFSIGELAEKANAGDLNLQPDYQRGFVWKTQACSNLVETVLLKLPIPEIWLHEQELINEGPDEESEIVYNVVDGKQRLTVLIGFYQNKNPLSKDPSIKDTSFKLQGLETMTEYNDKTYGELSKSAQKTYKDTPISVRKITYDSSPDGVYEVYKRINSGSENLNEQQIRRAAFKGAYIRLLDDLAMDKNLLKLYGRKDAHPKNADCEDILRFFAMRNSAHLFKAPMYKFLNKEMLAHKDMDADEQEDYRAIFRKTLELAMKFYYDEADKASIALLRSQRVWDFVLPVLAENLDLSFEGYMEALRADFRRLAATPEFEAVTRRGPVTAKSVKAGRKLFEDHLRSVLKDLTPKASPIKQFPNPEQLRKELFPAQDGRCNMCNDPIKIDGSFSHLDHIIPKSRGGLSTRENAQLLCAKCNLRKSNSMPLSVPSKAQ